MDDGPERPLPDDEAGAACPWCGEPVTLALDPWGGAVQSYVEDCQVCCRPWAVHVRWTRRGRARVELDPLDG
jgi:hypothetical protein